MSPPSLSEASEHNLKEPSHCKREQSEPLQLQPSATGRRFRGCKKVSRRARGSSKSAHEFFPVLRPENWIVRVQFALTRGLSLFPAYRFVEESRGESLLFHLFSDGRDHRKNPQWPVVCPLNSLQACSAFP